MPCNLGFFNIGSSEKIVGRRGRGGGRKGIGFFLGVSLPDSGVGAGAGDVADADAGDVADADASAVADADAGVGACAGAGDGTLEISLLISTDWAGKRNTGTTSKSLAPPAVSPDSNPEFSADAKNPSKVHAVQSTNSPVSRMKCTVKFMTLFLLSIPLV